ncbi:MAG TPA: hypothetical protein PKE32_10070, partial [Miltoncostaeaceae bacterium]|nr:hypothetical protein [Miltoncostaeaceae bacterium]
SGHRRPPPGTLPGMCSRVTCRTCGRPDWRGCGAHLEQVLGDVPAHQRCRCHEDGPPANAPARRGGLLGRLLGR